MPGRLSLRWRDWVMAGLAVVVFGLLVVAVYRGPARLPAVWTWTDPTSGELYQCALVDTDAAVYQCLPQKARAR
jgi:hypothetical protein